MSNDTLRIRAGRAEVGRSPAGIITDERACLTQPHNERCHQHDDG